MGLLDDLGSIFGGVGGASSPSAPAAQPMPGTQPMSLIGSLLGDVQPPGMDYAGTIAGGLGRSLLTSPSNNPLAGFSSGLQASAKANGLNNSQDALIQRLKALGFSEDQARNIAQNPSMAQSLFGSTAMTGPAGEPVPTFGLDMPGGLGINSTPGR